MRAADQLAVRRLNHRHMSITDKTRFCVPGREPSTQAYVGQVALTHHQPARFTVPRAAAVGGLVVVVAAVGAVAWRARSPAQLQPVRGDPWAA